MVGMTGFEPATPSSQARYATKLRYIPTLYYSIFNRLGSVLEVLYLKSQAVCLLRAALHSDTILFNFQLSSKRTPITEGFNMTFSHIKQGFIQVSLLEWGPCYIPMWF